MSDIVWEDPPPQARGLSSTDWGAFVAELRRHPGKWGIARAGGKAPGALGSTAAALKARGCEATQRKTTDGSYTLYARWPEDAS